MSATARPAPGTKPAAEATAKPAADATANPAADATANPAADVEVFSRTMRIGEVAELTGTTPRTIRYYEEIGLLAGGVERELGKHRCYTQADVDRIHEIVNLKELLGLSLEQLSQLLEAESARADIRRELKETEDPVRRRELVTRSLGHIGTQLTLVRGRIAELAKLERELKGRQQLGKEKLAQLDELLGADS